MRRTPEPAPEETEVWEPEPAIVEPRARGGAPGDAIVLFGDDLSEWRHEDGSPARWKVGDGWFEVVPGTGDIRTRRNFGDVQLHGAHAELGEIGGRLGLTGGADHPPARSLVLAGELQAEAAIGTGDQDGWHRAAPQFDRDGASRMR